MCEEKFCDISCFIPIFQVKFQQEFNLRLLVPGCQDEMQSFYASTDRNTCIDWCMRKDEATFKEKLKIYENWFSDHKALWLELQEKEENN